MNSSDICSKAWPDPALYYQLIPNNLLCYVAPVTVIVALIAIIFTVARPRRDREWQRAVPPVAAAAVSALAISVPDIAVLADVQHHQVSLPVSGLFAPLCVIAGALTWYAGLRVSSLNFDLLRQGAAAEDPG